jgi:hypothetical protein
VLSTKIGPLLCRSCHGLRTSSARFVGRDQPGLHCLGAAVRHDLDLDQRSVSIPWFALGASFHGRRLSLLTRPPGFVARVAFFFYPAGGAALSRAGQRLDHANAQSELATDRCDFAYFDNDALCATSTALGANDESSWWKKTGIDPLAAARALWLESHPLPRAVPITGNYEAAANAND